MESFSFWKSVNDVMSHNIGFAKGGVIYGNTFGEITMEKTKFIGNYGVMSSSLMGVDGQSITITDCEFNGNFAKIGGGLYVQATNTYVNSTIFINNMATGSGPGIYAIGNTAQDLSTENITFSISIWNSSFINNTIRDDVDRDLLLFFNGGAVYLGNVDKSLISDSYFFGNKANYGGNIIVR
jgi:hypothetical protein